MSEPTPTESAPEIPGDRRNLVTRFGVLSLRTRFMWLLAAAAILLVIPAAAIAGSISGSDKQPEARVSPVLSSPTVTFGASQKPTVSLSPSPAPSAAESTPAPASDQPAAGAPEAAAPVQDVPAADPGAIAPAPAPGAANPVPAAPQPIAPPPVVPAPAPPAPAPPAPAPPVGRTEGLNQSYASINNHRIASGVPGFVPLTAACSAVTTVTGTALDSYQHQDVVLGVFGRTTGAAFSKGVTYDTLTVYRCS